MVQSRARHCMVWMAIVAAGATSVAVRAQEHASAPSGPAPILVTVRETPKPGEEASHAQLEAQYAAALDAAKGSQYYLGMGAITGTPQSVFLTGYASLTEMADVHDYNETTIGDKLDGLAMDHSASLSGVDTAIWRLHPELSNPGTVNLAKMRFMELIHIHVKPGYSAEFAEMTKHIREGWMKADPDFRYSIYRQTFGSATDDSYLVVIAMKSLAELDKHHSMAAEYQKALGADVYKHMLEVERTAYNSTESNLFVFTPSMSRLPESWTRDDPAFWKPKPIVSAPAKKAVTAK